MIHAPTLRTNRLILRPLTLEDTDAFAKVTLADQAVGSSYDLLCDRSSPEAVRASARAWIESANQYWESHHWGGWAICSREESVAPINTLVGFCGFFEPDMDDDPSLAYGVGTAYAHQGIATEAARVALYYLFTKTPAHAVQTVLHPQLNKGAAAVLEKLGFYYVGDTDYLNCVARGLGSCAHYVIDHDIWAQLHLHKIRRANY